MPDMISKDLGPVSGYAIAVAHGYTGTEAQWIEEVLKGTQNAQTATQKAAEAAQSANTASQSATSASNSATTATQKASEAASSATAASGSATNAANSATTATQQATAASGSATEAANSASAAQEVLDSIPEDYTTLSNDVSDLKSSLNTITDKTFSATLTVASGNVAQNYNYDWVVGHTYRVYYLRSDSAGSGYVKAYTRFNGANVETITNELRSSNFVDFTPTSQADQIRIIAYSSGTVGVYDLAGVGQKTAFLESATSESLKREEDITYKFTYGYIDLSSGYGANIDTTAITASESVLHIVVPVLAGDKLTITGSGVTSARLYGVLDENKKVVFVAAENATLTNANVDIVVDGYFVANVKNSSPYVLTHNHYIVAASKNELEKDYTHITSPYDLAWVYGYYSSSGNKNSSDTRFRTLDGINIKAGSSVTVKSGAQIQTRFVPKNGTATYAGFSTRGVTFAQDGLLQLGIQYSNTSKINDISILDYLELNLFVEDNPQNVFSRVNNLKTIIPSNVYVGKHTDNTAFGQNTIYSDSIAAWRSLPSLASGYITETDLGAPYTDANHMYCYKLTPPVQGRSGKVLPHVFIVTSVHGHEKSATYGLYYLIKDMLDHAMDDPVLFYLRNFVRFTIMPMANPFGWDYNDPDLGEHGGTRYNENGINLNRNYGSTAWSDFDNDETYTVPWHYNARGTAPFSEPETELIRQQIINAGDVSLFIDLHTNGTDTTTKTQITYASLDNVDNDIVINIKSAIESYLIRNKAQMDNEYNVNIGAGQYYGEAEYFDSLNLKAQDWGSETLRIPSLTFEVPPGSTTGLLGADLTKYSPSLIKLCGEMIGNFIVNVMYQLNQ